MEFVRVSDKRTGHQYSIVEDAVDPEHHKVLADHAALDADGRPLPPKLKVPKAPVASYAGRKKADLQDEIARRNAERPDGDRIEVAGKGTVSDLVAALEADDEAHPHSVEENGSSDDSSEENQS